MARQLPLRQCLLAVGFLFLMFLLGKRSSSSSGVPVAVATVEEPKPQHVVVVNSRNKKSKQQHNSKVDSLSICDASNPLPDVIKMKLSRANRIANFLEGPGLEEWHDDSVMDATCKFTRDTQGTAFHFPHTMQQIYRCFSWWHANPHKRAVLLSPPTEIQQNYTVGFLKLLHDVFHVQMVTQREGRSVVRPRYDPVFDAETVHGGYKMRSPADFDFLRKRVKGYYKDGLHHAGCPSHDEGDGGDGGGAPPLPAVTILNRAANSGRHLLHAPLLKRILEEELGVVVHYVSSLDQASFMEQVALMETTDFLLSPHGAQWTSIPFLPSCAHVFEFFPVGYFVPKFYGTLAASAGHSYSHVYTGHDFEKESQLQNLTTRQNARARDLCVTEQAIRERILPALEDAMTDWQRCCGHTHHHH
jgi:hypothetical protein